jgi:hypothetical protein
MSVALIDISYDLIDGIFDVLNGNVIYSGTTYPVYKSIPKTPAPVYVFIGNVIQAEDGTKDAFIYNGTVQIHVVDESGMSGNLKLSQKILGVVRGLLKATKGAVFSIGGTSTLVVFSHESLTSLVSEADNGISNIRLVDMFNFLIQ